MCVCVFADLGSLANRYYLAFYAIISYKGHRKYWYKCKITYAAKIFESSRRNMVLEKQSASLQCRKTAPVGCNSSIRGWYGALLLDISTSSAV